MYYRSLGGNSQIIDSTGVGYIEGRQCDGGIHKTTVADDSTNVSGVGYSQSTNSRGKDKGVGWEEGNDHSHCSSDQSGSATPSLNVEFGYGNGNGTVKEISNGHLILGD